ncbi:hypothetical protein Efla_007160 [Eimeria flavescens]
MSILGEANSNEFPPLECIHSCRILSTAMCGLLELYLSHVPAWQLADTAIADSRLQMISSTILRQLSPQLSAPQFDCLRHHTFIASATPWKTTNGSGPTTQKCADIHPETPWKRASQESCSKLVCEAFWRLISA